MNEAFTLGTWRQNMKVNKGEIRCYQQEML